MRKRIWLLLVVELGIIAGIAALGDLRRHIPVFLLLFVAAAVVQIFAVRAARLARVSSLVVIVAAIMLRVPMFFTQPTLSDDVWRYIHDGRAQNAGVNPYRFAPADSATSTYRGPEYKHINHPTLRTIYPPIAQLAFRPAAAFDHPLIAWRMLLLLAEIAALAAASLIVGRAGGNPGNLALYAWHPLAIIEAIGSAHVEPVGVALMVGALALLLAGKRVAGGAVLAASVAAKLVAAPILLFAARNTRSILAFGVALVLIYVPFAMGANPLGSLGVFAETWSSNGSIYNLVGPLLGERLYRLIAAALLMVAILWLRASRVAAIDAPLIYFILLFLLSPVVHPWYLLWVLALVALRNDPFDRLGIAALYWCSSVVLAYTAHSAMLITGAWRIPGWILFIEYVPVIAMVISAGVMTRRSIAAADSRSRTSAPAPERPRQRHTSKPAHPSSD